MWPLIWIKLDPVCPGILDAAKFGRKAKSLLRQRQHHQQRHTFGQILTRKAQLRKKKYSLIRSIFLLKGEEKPHSVSIIDKTIQAKVLNSLSLDKPHRNVDWVVQTWGWTFLWHLFPIRCLFLQWPSCKNVQPLT